MKHLTFVLCLLALPLSSLHASEDITSLVSKLGDRSYREREKASASLRAHGPEVIPFLRKGLQSPDLEIRIRAKRILAFIRAREICKPRLFTYSAEKKKISVILHELESLTGERLFMSPEDFPESFTYKDGLAKDQVISITAKDKSVWEILDDLCVKTGTQVVRHYVGDSNRLCLMTQTEKNRNPHTANGPIHVQCTNSYFSSIDGTPVYGLQLTVLGEKKRPILEGSCRATVLSAVTDKGERLKSFPEYYYTAPDFHSTHHATRVTIARPSDGKATKTLKELRLEVSYAMAGEAVVKKGLVSTFKAKKVSVLKDLRVTPLSYSVTEGTTLVTLLVQRPVHGFYGHPSLDILDAKGKKIEGSYCPVWKVDTGYHVQVSYPVDSAVQYRVSYYTYSGYAKTTLTLKNVSLR